MLSYKIAIFIILLDLGIITALFPSIRKITGTWYVVGIVKSKISVEELRCWNITVESTLWPGSIEGTSSFIDERNERIVKTFAASVTELSELQVEIDYGGIGINKTMYSGILDLFFDGETGLVLIDSASTYFSVLYMNRNPSARENGTESNPIAYVDNTMCPWNEIRTTEEPEASVDEVEPPVSTPDNPVKATTRISAVDSSPSPSTEPPFHNTSATSNQNSLISNKQYNVPDVRRPIVYFQSTAHSFCLSNFLMLLSFAQLLSL